MDDTVRANEVTANGLTRESFMRSRDGKTAGRLRFGRVARVLALALVALVALFGCAGEEETESSAETSSGETEAADSAAETTSTDSEEPAETTETTETTETFKSASFQDWELEWRVQGENLAVSISYPSTGWLAVGFDPSRMMQDANIMIGYVSADGEVVLTDQYGTATTAHQPDEELGGSNDLSEVEGSEEDGVTTLSFVMPLDSGDEYDKPLTPGESYRVLVARGPDGQDDLTTYHAGRGGFEITL